MATIASVAALLAAGCGSSDSSTTDGAGGTAPKGGGNATAGGKAVKSGSLSKSEFIQRVETICQESRDTFLRKFRLLVKQRLPEGKVKLSPEAEDDARVALVETIIVPVYEEQIERIGELGAPRGDEAEIESFLEATQENLDEATTDPIQYLKAESQEFAEAGDWAKAYGLAGCARAMDLTQGITV